MKVSIFGKFFLGKSFDTVFNYMPVNSYLPITGIPFFDSHFIKACCNGIVNACDYKIDCYENISKGSRILRIIRKRINY